MLKFAVVLSLVAFALAGTIPEVAEFQSSRIVGGATATLGQFQYQASLRTTGNVHFCGGALISSNWVLSAAHCTIGRSGSNTIVVFGVIHRITGGTTHAISQIVNHPSYAATTLANDISLLETTVGVITTANVAPALLGSAFIGGGTTVVMTGWGQTDHPGTAATDLQFLHKSTLTNADCRSRFSVANANRVFDNTICTFNGDHQGMCMGDSGGPLANVNTVIGVISWGIACATGSPDVHARVSSHRAWIVGITGIN